MYSWGDSPLIVMGVIIQYLLGVKIRGLLPLRVLIKNVKLLWQGLSQYLLGYRKS